MTLSDDIADDYEEIDAVETVTYTPRVGNAVETVKGLRRAVRTKDVMYAANLGLQGVDTAWHLWVSTLDGLTPEVNATITSGSDVWDIRDASLETLSTRYKCLTRKRT